MAQTGFTPIQIYSSSTAAAAPLVANLTNSTLGSELAINITDGKLFYKDNANAIQVIGWKTTPTTAGGTGLTSYTAGDLLYYASGSSLSKLGIGGANTILKSTGSAPAWETIANLAVESISFGSTGLTPNTATKGAVTVAGTLATTNGGTALTSFTSGGVLYASSTSALATGSALTFTGTNLGVGVASATSLIQGYSATTSALLMTGDSSTNIISNRASTDAAGPALSVRKARGTIASPTAVASSDTLGTLFFQGYGGTTVRNLASIRGVVTTYTSDTNISARLIFSTSAAGGVTATDRLVIDAPGNVSVISAAKLGYGTGSGGTVTQATSKATAVTLDKPTGQITMNGAALGAGASETFLVNDSVVASTDTVILASPAFGLSYRIECSTVGAGLFYIRITNVTGGSLSEAVVINFTVISGATS